MLRNFLMTMAVLLTVGCTENISLGQTDTETQILMRAEFMESCGARPEYVSRKRAGTLDKLCTCIFNTTMKGLSEDEKITAAFYLYGETHENYRSRLSATSINPETMMVAAEAVGKAAKRCH